jgi:hypothetical protein
MKKYLLILIMLLITTTAHSQAAFRLCDKEGDCIDFDSDGKLQIGTATADTGTDGAGPQIRICDKDGDCLDITSDGELQLQ